MVLISMQHIWADPDSGKTYGLGKSLVGHDASVKVRLINSEAVNIPYETAGEDM